MIIKNAKVYTPEHRFKVQNIVIRNGRIVRDTAGPQVGEEVIDAAGLTALLLIPILDYYNVPLRRQDEPPALSPEEQSVILEVIGKK